MSDTPERVCRTCRWARWDRQATDKPGRNISGRCDWPTPDIPAIPVCLNVQDIRRHLAVRAPLLWRFNYPCGAWEALQTEGVD